MQELDRWKITLDAFDFFAFLSQKDSLQLNLAFLIPNLSTNVT